MPWRHDVPFLDATILHRIGSLHLQARSLYGALYSRRLVPELLLCPDQSSALAKLAVKSPSGPLSAGHLYGNLSRLLLR